MRGLSIAALVLLSGYGRCANAAATGVVLEAERFSTSGGWVVDAQFMDQMGSPYLLAHGLGRPVADASTSFDVTETGDYTLWVRTCNWSARWSAHGAAGRFHVLLDGNALSAELGTGSAEWRWVSAGNARLAAGSHTLTLHDLTGFDGRCDAVVLLPVGATAQDAEALRAAERSKAPTVTERFDFVVVGGGIAGISAAITAARAGLKTALVQDRPVLGGNNSSEVRVHLGAYLNLPPYPRLGDVTAEIAPAHGGNARPAANYEDARKLAVVRAESNLRLFLNTRVQRAEKTGDRISSVIGTDVRTGAHTRFVAPLFADTTGDGCVGFLAGADFAHGREACAQYGEPWAPEKADTMTMGASVQWYAERGAVSAFPEEEWMLPFDVKCARPIMRGDWNWETGMMRDAIADAERIRDYGLLVVYSNWSFVKNASPRARDFATAHLAWVAHVAGKRESRRLLGDFVLTERHIEERDIQRDATCAATWTIDQHFPRDAKHTGFNGESFQAESRNHVIWPYPIPYRCYYSRNVGNLLMAGRDISVSHVALGTTRLMRTHGMMGEVVGMAAAVCHAERCSPREVYATHFEKLVARMRQGAGKGGAQPLQDYNVQESQDKSIKQTYLQHACGQKEDNK